MKKDPAAIILTRQELQIMKVVWELGSASVKEVCTSLSRKKPTAYTTILTLMGILEDKGALGHIRCGRAYIYRPLISRERATSNQIADLIDRFFDGHPEKLIESVVENQGLSAGQLESLVSKIRLREEHQLA